MDTDPPWVAIVYMVIFKLMKNTNQTQRIHSFCTKKQWYLVEWCPICVKIHFRFIIIKHICLLLLSIFKYHRSLPYHTIFYLVMKYNIIIITCYFNIMPFFFIMVVFHNTVLIIMALFFPKAVSAQHVFASG